MYFEQPIYLIEFDQIDQIILHSAREVIQITQIKLVVIHGPLHSLYTVNNSVLQIRRCKKG